MCLICLDGKITWPSSWKELYYVSCAAGDSSDYGQLRERRAAEKKNCVRVTCLIANEEAVLHGNRESKQDEVNARRRAEEKQMEDVYTGILHSRASKMLKNG
jgi:hypothetical protein